MRLMYLLIYLLLFAVGYGIGAIYQINAYDEVEAHNNAMAMEFEKSCYDMNGTYKYGECVLNWD